MVYIGEKVHKFLDDIFQNRTKTGTIRTPSLLLSKHRMNSVSNKDLSGKKPSCLMNKQSKILVQCMTDYLLQHFAWATVRKVIIIMYFVLLTLWVPEFFDDSWRTQWLSLILSGGYLFRKLYSIKIGFSTKNTDFVVDVVSSWVFLMTAEEHIGQVLT